MKPDRTARVIAALGERISHQGDMHIRVSRLTMRTLLRGVGISGWEMGEDEFREVDALALDALRHLAWLRLPIAPAQSSGSEPL